ncbi:MAG: hypothetical protein GY832_02640 [Chloroflexi bacterium]|nr:hypothetical protein [Chloroflexota bacterium]
MTLRWDDPNLMNPPRGETLAPSRFGDDDRFLLICRCGLATLFHPEDMPSAACETPDGERLVISCKDKCQVKLKYCALGDEWVYEGLYERLMGGGSDDE